MNAARLSLGLVALVFVTGSGPAHGQSLEDRRAQCMNWMVTGYPSGLEETACTAQFALPSPFLFKCARAQKTGFRDLQQRKACKLFFENASLATANGYVRN